MCNIHIYISMFLWISVIYIYVYIVQYGSGDTLIQLGINTNNFNVKYTCSKVVNIYNSKPMDVVVPTALS